MAACRTCGARKQTAALRLEVKPELGYIRGRRAMRDLGVSKNQGP